MKLFEITIHHVKKLPKTAGRPYAAWETQETKLNAMVECDDATLGQAVAMFLNHIATEVKNRETQEKLVSNVSDYYDRLASAQLQHYFGITNKPDEFDSGLRPDRDLVYPTRPDNTDCDSSGATGVRGSSAEAKLYQEGD